LLDALALFVDFVADRGERFGERIVDLLGIDNDDAFAFAEDDVARDPNYGGIIGNVAQDDGSGADAAVFSDGDVAKKSLRRSGVGLPQQGYRIADIPKIPSIGSSGEGSQCQKFQSTHAPPQAGVAAVIPKPPWMSAKPSVTS